MKKRISVGVILMMLILMLIPVQVFAANSIKLNKSAVSVYKNTSEKLKAKVVGKKKTVKWTTSDKSIATVKNGKVTGKKAGKAIITATANGVSTSCTVTVNNPVITLNKTSMTLGEGDKSTLTAVVKGAKKTVKWTTSNPKVVSVSKGKVTVKGTGTAIITAAANGVKASCTVSVKGVDYKNLYYQFLKKAQTSFSYKEGLYTKSAIARSFYLLHMNSDSVPELIVSQETMNIGTPENFWIFTIKNNKVVYCGSVFQKGASNIRYNPKYKAICQGWWTNGVGGSGDALWQVEDGKLKQIKYAYSYLDGRKRIYKTGNTQASSKKVSRASSEKFGKKYFNSKDIISGTRLQNTESVRLKQFK